jgi:hypothetical protein
MNTSLLENMQSSFNYVLGQIVNEMVIYVPKILGALVIFLVGLAIAKMLKRVVVRLLEALRISSLVQNTPVEHFLKNADATHKIEEIIGGIFYWIVMLLVLNTAVAVLGLNTVSFVLDKLLSYLPHVFSAVIVLVFGVLLAGLVESVVKGSIRSIDGKAARLLGKLSSYLVVTLAILASVSELGIASDFIMVILIGVVATMSIGFGLALGLGGQEVVRKMLNSWYSQFQKETKE